MLQYVQTLAIVFENGETVHVRKESIRQFQLDDMQLRFVGDRLNGFKRYIEVSGLQLVVHCEAKKERETLRLVYQHDNIVCLIVTYEDGEEERIDMPWDEDLPTASSLGVYETHTYDAKTCEWLIEIKTAPKMKEGE